VFELETSPLDTLFLLPVPGVQRFHVRASPKTRPIGRRPSDSFISRSGASLSHWVHSIILGECRTIRMGTAFFCV